MHFFLLKKCLWVSKVKQSWLSAVPRLLLYMFLVTLPIMVSNFLHVTLTEFPEICLSWEVDATCADKNKPWSNETVFPCYNSCERHRVISNQDKTKAFACRIPVYNNLIFYAKVKVECHDTQIPNLLPFYFPNCSIYFQTSILIFDFPSQ